MRTVGSVAVSPTAQDGVGNSGKWAHSHVRHGRTACPFDEVNTLVSPSFSPSHSLQAGSSHLTHLLRREIHSRKQRACTTFSCVTTVYLNAQPTGPPPTHNSQDAALPSKPAGEAGSRNPEGRAPPASPNLGARRRREKS